MEPGHGADKPSKGYPPPPSSGWALISCAPLVLTVNAVIILISQLRLCDRLGRTAESHTPTSCPEAKSGIEGPRPTAHQ